MKCSLVFFLCLGAVLTAAFPEPQFENAEIRAAKLGNRANDAAQDLAAKPLFEAVRNGDEAGVEKLLESGLNVNQRDSHDRTALHIATLEGKDNIVEYLLNHGADVDATDDTKTTALHRAAEKNNVKIAELLIKNKSYIDRADESGFTALHRSAVNGHIEVGDLLVKSGADVSLQDSHDYDALKWAIMKGHGTAFKKMLFDNGISEIESDSSSIEDSDETDDSDRAFLNAAIEGDLERLRSLLKGRNIDVKDIEGNTALLRATENRHFELVDLLLKNGANASLPNNLGTTPLHWCVLKGASDWNRDRQKGYENVAELLIKNNADVNYVDVYGETPLDSTIVHGNEGVAEILIKNGGKTNRIDLQGHNGLENAVIRGNVKLVELLIGSGEDVNVYNSVTGESVLHLVLQIGEKGHHGYNPAIVELLLNNGANVDAVDKFGRTPLYVAAKTDSWVSMKYLVQKKANVNLAEKHGKTPLHEAAKLGRMHAVEILLEAGADLEAKDKKGRTPKDMATRRGRTRIAKLITDKATKLEHIETTTPAVKENLV